jgi:hypothetical protein
MKVAGPYEIFRTSGKVVYYIQVGNMTFEFNDRESAIRALLMIGDKRF